MIGQHALQFWSPTFDREAIRKVLQSPHATNSEAFGRLEARFREWYASTFHLPGAYYLQVVEQLFKEALEMHIEMLKVDGLPVPEPKSDTGRVLVAA